MPDIEIEGRRLHYEDVGEGSPVLLLHGFPFSSESFWPQLEAPWPQVRWIVPDHRGFGRSEATAELATMDAMADDALALLDALDLPQAVIAGVSMGGYVALALTRRAPARVKALALIDTQATPDDAAAKQRREAVAQDVEARGVGPLTEGMLPKLLSPHASAPVRARLEQLMRAQAPAAVASASRGMAQRLDGRDVLTRLAAPALVVVGELDGITPPDRAREMAGLLAHAQLTVIPHAAHLPNLEQPQAFKEAMGSFLSSINL